MDFTGERILSSIGGRIALEHLHRYAIAQQMVEGKIVLDIASGEGYGSQLLSFAAAEVVGVDLSAEAVAYARARYVRPNLKFMAGSATAIPLDDLSVDAVVSFETIEHLADHELMISEIKRVMKPGGLLIISSPDKEFYSDATGHQNEFHVKELYRHEFEDLIRKNFRNHCFFYQGFFIGGIVFRDSPAKLESFTGSFHNIGKTTGLAHQYNLAICSDSPLSNLPENSALTNDSLYQSLETYFDKKIESIYSSKSYRIGNMIVRAIRLFLPRK